jgi:hypothetical protein
MQPLHTSRLPTLSQNRNPSNRLHLKEMHLVKPRRTVCMYVRIYIYHIIILPCDFISRFEATPIIAVVAY